jgi:hypothetical protein
MNLVTFTRSEFGPILASALSKEVPGEMLSADTAEDGTPVWCIPCPCGEQPEVKLGQIEVCGCGRYFANYGEKVKVYKPSDEASAEVSKEPEPLVD